MDKIAVKHYLNSNVKPYHIRGENFFPVYILVRARGRSTRVRSHLFSDVYTEDHFAVVEDFPDSKLVAEASTIESIVEAQMEINERDFDPHLFGVLYNLMPKYLLEEIYRPSQILQAFTGLNDISVYRWFNEDVQGKLKKHLVKEKMNHRIMQARYNASIIYGFFKILRLIVPSNPTRYRIVSSTYKTVFNAYEALARGMLKDRLTGHWKSTSSNRYPSRKLSVIVMINSVLSSKTVL